MDGYITGVPWFLVGFVSRVSSGIPDDGILVDFYGIFLFRRNKVMEFPKIPRNSVKYGIP